MKMKMEIERICSICGKKFVYNDEMGKVYAEAWEICPDCWLGKNEDSKKSKN